MNLNIFLEVIHSLSKPGKNFKPHKYLALLSIIDVIKDQPAPFNEFRYDNAFRERFTKYFNLYHGPNDSNRSLNPFFHLKNTGGFWHLKPLLGKEAALKKLTTVGSPRDLHDVVDFAYLSPDILGILSDPVSRDIVVNTIQQILEMGLNKRSEEIINEASSRKNDVRFCLFQHEAQAIESLNTAIDRHKLGKTINNLLINDEQTNEYYECDLIVISHSGIYLVELKYWSGNIRIAPYNWIKDEVVYRRDPHAANVFKAKILKGIYQHQFRSYPNVWVESVVILTNPAAEVEGSSQPRTDKHCPTFDSIDVFIDYLRYRKGAVSTILKDENILHVREYFESLRQIKAPRSYNLPGYEVVQHLTQRSDLIEIVARPTDGRYRTLKRFRIFFPPYDLEDVEKKRFALRARGTIDAVSRIGDHPNILKVWPVPDESGALIEGSEWSEEGTLRDMINSRKNAFGAEEALQICTGILKALEASHQEGVVHRAVKPENILMGNKIPKLMNYDLSYQLENGEHITVIPDITALKRDAYTAPEVLRGQDVDESTDLFSVGVILFELLTGERPFKTSTDLDNIGGRLSEKLLSKLESHGVAKNIRDALDNLIRSDRKERLRSAMDALSALSVSESEVERVSPLRPLNKKLRSGDTYDVYTIEGLIGQGAEAQVYEARSVGAERVALKIFNRDIPLIRIQREEKAASAVHSSFLVHAKRLGHWNNERYFLELSFIEGRRMREDILEGKQPNIETFISIASCLMGAVNTLHHRIEDDSEAPILHSDIKPDNIILMPDVSAVLIDFGIAGPPRIDSYQGTEGYVAPDLMRGADLQFCEEGDLFALGVSLFEWLCGRKPYDTPRFGDSPIDITEIRSDIPESLIDWLVKAVASSSSDRFHAIDDMQNAFELAKSGAIEIAIPADAVPATERRSIELPHEPIVEFVEEEEIENPFVAYLNTLHNATVNNENALAESQAVNPYFGYIHVPSKVTDYIFEQLTSEIGTHVILTGHAGDGKSTIGLELFKRLKGMPHEKPLKNPMRAQEEVSIKNRTIVLVKDMSELTESQRSGLLDEAYNNKSKLYFIISNTGTLLNSFEQCAKTRADWLELQNYLLKALESNEPETVNYKGGYFKLINLIQIDNIETACRVFERMLAMERWENCEKNTCREKCPIYQNVKMLREHWETIGSRIELAYRRLYEYGFRLTLRQITGHLAYSITAGLGYESIKQLSEKAVRPPLREFLFFNRFFGTGWGSSDLPEEQLRAIREIRRLESGYRPHPKCERYLWMKDTSDIAPTVKSNLEPTYKKLLEVGSGKIVDELLTPESSRIQMRRLLYFFGIFNSKEEERAFVSTFLNSPMLVDFVRWQHSGGALNLMERKKLKRDILHVLQEHFTGIRLPENAGDQENIFITINRHSYEIRQSAQIVLAKLSADDFELDLAPCDNGISGIRYELRLRSNKNGVSLALDLPFLDYVTNRHNGEIAQQLQSFYVDRLEKFKVGLLAREKDNQKDDIILVRLLLNNKFKSQIFSIRDNVLEVA
jgi:serine/threonine protein kinase